MADTGRLADEDHQTRVRACAEFLDPSDPRARRFVPLRFDEAIGTDMRQLPGRYRGYVKSWIAKTDRETTS